MTSQIGVAPGRAERPDAVTLDRRVIAEFGRGADGSVPEFVVGLISQFIEEASAQVEQMRDAGQRADAPALKAIAHSLRGSSNMLGAKRLAILCEQIERGAGQRGFSTAEALLSDVDQEFVNVRYALKAELQGAGDR